LKHLASIGSGNVDGSDDGGGGFYIEFVGALSNLDVGALTGDSSLKQAAATVTMTETQEGAAPAPTSPSIDDDFTDGDESNPATMSFTFSPSPTSGSWTVDGNTFAWDQTPTATGWSFNGLASSNPTATADSNGSTSPALCKNEIEG